MNNDNRSESPLLTYVLLVSLLLSCGSFGVFMLQQAPILNAQVVQDRRVITEFRTALEPRYDWFVSSLQVYAQRNPDFKPVLAKYGLLTGTLEQRVGLPSPSK
jgi:hypothetical protein